MDCWKEQASASQSGSKARRAHNLSLGAMSARAVGIKRKKKNTTKHGWRDLRNNFNFSILAERETEIYNKKIHLKEHRLYLGI